jgi:hypothetical protein
LQIERMSELVDCRIGQHIVAQKHGAAAGLDFGAQFRHVLRLMTGYSGRGQQVADEPGVSFTRENEGTQIAGVHAHQPRAHRQTSTVEFGATVRDEEQKSMSSDTPLL